MPGLSGNRRDTHARLIQRAEPTYVHPLLRIQDHRERSLFGLVCLVADKPKGDHHSRQDVTDAPTTLDVRSYPLQEMRPYADNSLQPGTSAWSAFGTSTPVLPAPAEESTSDLTGDINDEDLI